MEEKGEFSAQGHEARPIESVAMRGFYAPPAREHHRGWLRQGQLQPRPTAAEARLFDARRHLFRNDEAAFHQRARAISFPDFDRPATPP